jgi:hypothetical protein
MANGTPAAFTTIERALLAVAAEAAESVTVTVKFEVAAAFGVPVMAPVVAFRPRPAGRVPAEIDQA